MLEAISSLGGLAPIVAVVVVFSILITFLLKWILAYMEKKDERFIKHINDKDEKFSKVIENHINHSIVANEKIVASHNQLADIIRRLADRLNKR